MHAFDGESVLLLQRRHSTIAMIQLGKLHISLSSREILLNGEIVCIGSRAFDVLAVLLRAKGEMVAKEVILSTVWPNTIVEENNLQVHISSLRKLLGDDKHLIQTTPGRGYRIVGAQVAPESTPAVKASTNVARPCKLTNSEGRAADEATLRLPFDAEQHAVDETPQGRHNLPVWSSPLIGRDQVCMDVAQMLASQRLVTISGAGGMGKTRVAISVANGSLQQFRDDVFFLDFASVANDQGVFDEFAKATRAPAFVGSREIEKMIAPFRRRQSLFVFDNCEHVLVGAATLAQAISRHCASVRILATSREPLNIDGETLYTLPPLAVPSGDDSWEDALACSAVALFIKRARPSNLDFEYDATSMQLIANICRRLDGMPLAIELAAIRATVLGIQTVSAHLDDRFRILTGGYRTALPRHQTLRATLDWSYELLTDSEQLLLRRLSLFPNGFSINAMRAVCSDQGLSPTRCDTSLAGLVSKSLVNVTRFAHDVRYRLLESTRAYASQKLNDHGESRQLSFRYATFLHDVLGTLFPLHHTGKIPRFDDSLALQSNDSVATANAEMIDAHGIKLALTWAFSDDGDVSIAVPLAAAASYWFFEKSMVRECCDWAARGRQLLRSCENDASVLSPLHLSLTTAYAAGLVYTSGPTSQTKSLWSEASADAQRLKLGDFAARAIWGMWNAAQYGGNARSALRHALDFELLAKRENVETNQVLSQRLIGIAHHFAGNQIQSQKYLTAMLTRYAHTRHQLSLLGFSIDHSVVARATLSRVLWLRGNDDEAWRVAQTALQRGHDLHHEMSLAYVLVEAHIPISLMSGNTEKATRFNRQLSELATHSGFEIWDASSRCFEALIDLMQTRFPSSTMLAAYETAFARLEATGFLAHRTMLQAIYAQSVSRAGFHQKALNIVHALLSDAEQTGDLWYSSALWCLLAQISSELNDTGMPPTPTVDQHACLIRAQEVARQQGATYFYDRAKHAMNAVQKIDHRRRRNTAVYASVSTVATQ
ncbi:winged helix-turn-helix domain-containing protein [Robbsia andropogonis]|nr:winged helix-turn-helix domain-containing protein [Robbsia andropogonis]MCP1130220.1 winged helix-turn-helix domain-containing protein [Robbsia andropogonis]